MVIVIIGHNLSLYVLGVGEHCTVVVSAGYAMDPGRVRRPLPLTVYTDRVPFHCKTLHLVCVVIRFIYRLVLSISIVFHKGEFDPVLPFIAVQVVFLANHILNVLKCNKGVVKPKNSPMNLILKPVHYVHIDSV